MKTSYYKFTALLIALLIATTVQMRAQEPIKFNKKGIAKISEKIPSNSDKTYVISGKAFKAATLNFTKCEGLGVTIKQGSKFLSSGHSTGVKVKLKSNKKENFLVIITNKTKKTLPLNLSVVVSQEQEEI